MIDTYSRHADICAKFYALTVDSNAVAKFVLAKTHAVAGQSALFVGAMFGVAAALIDSGLRLTVVDYTDEMVAIGKHLLPTTSVYKADLRSLPFEREFDHVFIVGRVFTHMISDKDLSRAIQSCRSALRLGGRMFADNYEDSRICVTNYFNGTIEYSDSVSHIKRESRTTQVSTDPFVVQWDAKYSGSWNGKPFSFDDSMKHRAFARGEFASHLANAGFNIVSQGENFDETSFYTCAEIAA